MAHDAHPPDPSGTAAAASPAGQVIGGYRIERALGTGGLGSVHVAIDPIGRRVALKVFSLRGDDDGVVAQAFQREARIGRRLAHPDIVALLDYGRDGELGFVAMELVEGTDLTAHTHAAQRLPPATIGDIASRIAGALAHAHGLGVLHRDIKPGNILVHPPTHTVKLADFGLARLGDVFRSRTGLITGTPAYMSPEQLSESPLDARSDLYSLGVVIFQLLATRLPHEAASMGELLRRLATEPAPDVREFRPETPAPLATLVARLLQTSPPARPASAKALQAELRAIRPAIEG